MISYFRLSIASIAILQYILVPLSASEPPASRWMTVICAGKKMGYIEQTRTVTNGTVVQTEKMHLDLLRDITRLTFETSMETTETVDGRPISFLSTSSAGGMISRTQGSLTTNGQLNITLTSAGQTKNMTLEWPKGALLPEGARILARSKGLKEHQTYEFKAYTPELLGALNCTVTVGGTTNVDLLGRVVSLTVVSNVLHSPDSAIAVTAWVDDSFEEQKIQMTMLGMTLEMIACPKAFAVSPGSALDLTVNTILRSPRPFKEEELRGSIRYDILVKSGSALPVFPVTAEQKTVLPGVSGGALRLDITPCHLPQDAVRPYKGSSPAALASLLPSRYIESDSPDIAALARLAVGTTADAAAASRKIEAFVSRYIRKKNLSVGYATALEVAKSREGDCSEHAVLTAAICRAAGIPARVAFGITFAEQFTGRKDVFVPHAWTQVMLNGEWYSLDAALEGFDASHIAVAVGNGDPDEFLGMLNSWGSFTIAAAEARDTAIPAKQHR